MVTNRLVTQAIKLLSDNAPTILTAMGVTGTVMTAYLTGRASVKAVEIIREESEVQELDPKEKVLLTWKEFIPPLAVGALTVSCIIGVNRIGMRRTAAIAAAYSLSEKAFDEYRNKVAERFSESKEQRLRDDIAQDQVRARPVQSSEVIFTGSGDVLCYDSITGRYFTSDVETIRKAQNDINYQILNNMYASLHDFYKKIGLPGTPYSHEVGWNLDNLLDVKFSAVIADDGRPCISINYGFSPSRAYHQLQ